MGKITKAYHYLKDRLFEFRICIQEFISESKLDRYSYQEHYKSRLLVEAHSVEKGIGLKNAEPGHSAKVVILLLDKLFKYIEMGFDIKDFAFRESLRIIMAYIEFQKSYDILKFKEFAIIEKKYNLLCSKLDTNFLSSISKELSAGCKNYTKEELLRGAEFDFAEFTESRHSIRSYEKAPLSDNLIKQAVKIANSAPSACNRQPNHVYFTNSDKVVNCIDRLITGSNGFKGEIPNFLVVTTTRSAFAKEEQFQWYINGGIYVSYLTLALHSLGIGNCIMQWKAFYKTEHQLKELLQIPKSEAIIAVIGCGYYTNETKCIYAQRREPEDTLSVI